MDIMKLKYYMCGLGSGIILAVLIMTIANKISAGVNTANNVNTQETTGSIIAYTTQADTKDNTKEAVTASEKNEDDKLQSGTSDNVSVSSQSDAVRDTTKAYETETVINTTASQQESVLIHIDAVTVASDIARMLEDKGIIDDADGFIQYIYDQGYSRVLQEGDFELSKGDTYENVAKIITRQ